MNMEDFNVVLTIDQCKSISKAANRLFISQSSLSYKLSALESELGVKLFKRQKGHATLELTEEGARFLVIAEKMRDLTNEARQLGAEKGRTKLVVAGVDSVNQYFLLDFYRRFVRENLGIELTVINDYSEEILKKVERRRYDVGISNAHYNFLSIRSEVLFKEEYVCLKRIDPEEKPAKKESISVRDLEPEREVYQGFDFNLVQWRNLVFPKPMPKFVTEIVKLSVELMDTVGDWCIMPYTVARHYSERPEYQMFRLDTPPHPRVVYVTTNLRNSAYHAESILLFQKRLKEFIQDHCLGDMVYL